ncbi:MAG TPA: hypothetical protein VMG12_32275 [Polyangiaceae bacterium]|nr:hypothetical protein [Polyangiaceae bacterium]
MSARRLAAMSALCVLAWSGAAAAYHTDDDHITDDTAWTLKGPKNYRLGLYKASATIADRVVIGTYIWPWLARTASLFAKWRFLSIGPWHWAAEGAVFHLDTSRFDGTGPNAPVFTIGTATLANTLELGDHQISNNLIGTAVRLKGEIDDDTLGGAGEGGLSNLQYVLAYQYRVSRTLALVVTGRYQIFQVLGGQTSFTSRPDDYTSIEVVAAASDDHIVNFRYALSVVPALAWSWENFNLRVGLGYGNFNIPGINFMLEQRTLIPELDLYFTF